MKNILKDVESKEFKDSLTELTDLESLNLLEAVSDDMKRRNNLLRGPDEANSEDIAKSLIEAIMGGIS